MGNTVSRAHARRLDMTQAEIERTRLIHLLDPVKMFQAIEHTDPFPYQVKQLRSRNPKQAWLQCRQSGKSTTARVRLLAAAARTVESESILVAQSEAVAVKQLGYVRRSLRDLVWLEATNKNATSLTLSNGACISALSSDPGASRGLTIDGMAFFDEAALISDECFTAAFPGILTAGGEIVLASTAGWQMGGEFHRAMTDDDSYERFIVPVDECPRYTVDPTVIPALRRAMGDDAFAVEYECRFSESDNISVFGTDQILRLLPQLVEDDRADDDVPPPLTLPSLQERLARARAARSHDDV